MVPWYAQCRHEGGGTIGGGSGEDAVRVPPECGSMAVLVLRLWGLRSWCLYPRPSACAAAPRVRWRVPYLLAICSLFSRFIRRIRFIICASA